MLLMLMLLLLALILLLSAAANSAAAAAAAAVHGARSTQTHQRQRANQRGRITYCHVVGRVGRALVCCVHMLHGGAGSVRPFLPAACSPGRLVNCFTHCAPELCSALQGPLCDACCPAASLLLVCRQQRHGMVQTREQYTFCHTALLHFVRQLAESET